MKKILITGANSYIGVSTEQWLNRYSGQYKIVTINMHGDSWKENDFSCYDSVFHVAGLAHSDIGKASEAVKESYYTVNCELAVEAAKKAKKSGVKQFIYMSSIIVYGNSGNIGEEKVITKHTQPCPSNFYGDSKLQAEKQLVKLSDAGFSVAIIRAPMVYGRGSKGNYRLLSKLVKYIPLFPDIKNERSMIHIDNLNEFVRLLIDSGADGCFFPQNKEYVSTTSLVKRMASVRGRKIWLTKILNKEINMLSKYSLKARIVINKVFGNLVYDQGLSDYEYLFGMDYRVRTFDKSVALTEE